MRSQDIELPHINYTVRIRAYGRPPRAFEGVEAWVERTSKWACTVHLKKDALASTVAHELVHVLQFICLDRHMDFILEQEHMAYIMQYLMMTIGGGRWERPKNT